MKLLLDTHVLIWSVLEPDQLSKQVINLFIDRNNDIFFSLVSIWEMQIKIQLGKLNFTVPLSEIIASQQHAKDLQLLAITPTHIYALEHLPNHHCDPFECLLVAQAMTAQMPLLSADAPLDGYPTARWW